MFVILTVEAHGVKGTFTGTAPAASTREAAYEWALPQALREIFPFGRDGSAAVLFFSAEPAGGA
jgi:hypothetical protein